MDSKGELLITIMSSLAQEESRSISENTTWGIRQGFSEGKFSMPYGQFLGYRKGENGTPEIVPEEAEIVRGIYRSFLDGETPGSIARLLTARGVPSPAGKGKWHETTVRSMLQNEKYYGSALLQKHYTTDFLTHKVKKNEGELSQYYIENSHPAIITKEGEGRLTIEDGIRSGEPLPGRYPLRASGLSEFTFGALLRGSVVIPYVDLYSLPYTCVLCGVSLIKCRQSCENRTFSHRTDIKQDIGKRGMTSGRAVRYGTGVLFDDIVSYL